MSGKGSKGSKGPKRRKGSGALGQEDESGGGKQKGARKETQKTPRGKAKPAPSRKGKGAKGEASGGERGGHRKAGDESGRRPPVRLPDAGLAEDVLRRVAAESREGGDREAIYRFAERLPQPEREEPAPQRLETWVRFRLHGETYALPVSHVREIVRVESITRVPGGPREIRGVTNVRGRVIPVVDLRVRLELPRSEIAPEGRVLVAEARGRPIGLLVDAVRAVERLDLLAVEAPPEEVRTPRSDHVLGVLREGDELTLLLDVERVLLLDAPRSGGSGGPGEGDDRTADGGA
ncbi:MAG: chemotaxis protein CheW [Thermoanaerobaculia bacterium]